MNRFGVNRHLQVCVHGYTNIKYMSKYESKGVVNILVSVEQNSVMHYRCCVPVIKESERWNRSKIPTQPCVYQCDILYSVDQPYPYIIV